ncbi:hypothetical protein OIU78_029184 [Salix suchowensis]|nr:hypothetical protein OIU78_029184 [Salix suchowensis]
MSDPKTSHQPTPTPVSWAEKVKVSNANTRCTLEHLPRKPVGATLTIPRDMQMADVEIWERSMVGFFVSYKLPFHAVQAIASRIWKAHGLEKTMVLSNGFMVFRFSSTSAMEEVLARGPWMFGGKTVLLQKWTPGFQFDKNKIRAIPVWARLQGLPFPLWNKKGLSMAASMVGKPLASDEATLQGTRLEYARVCIEIEADLPLVHKFQVASSLSEDPITVDVTYEWKPSKCDICKVFGHACKVQSREEDLIRKRDEVGETEAVVHPHPPIPKQVQKSSVAKEKATGKGDHEGSDMGDAEERNAGLLTRSQKGKNIIEEDGENDMIREDQRDNVGIRTVNKVSSMSSGMGAQEVDRGALNKEASTCSEVEGRTKDNETTRSSLPKDKPQDSEASRSSYSDKPSETEGSTSTPKQAKKHKGGKKRRGTHSPRQ